MHCIDVDYILSSFIQSFINFKRTLHLIFSIHPLQKEIKISFHFFRRNSYSHWQGNRQGTQCSTRINFSKPCNTSFLKFYNSLEISWNCSILLKFYTSLDIVWNVCYIRNQTSRRLNHVAWPARGILHVDHRMSDLNNHKHQPNSSCIRLKS